MKLPVRPPDPDDLRAIVAYIKKHRTATSRFDVVKIGWTVSKDPEKNA